MNKINWIPGDCGNYKSDDGKYIAIFMSGFRGLCSYKVYSAEIAEYERNGRNMLSVGGLPENEFWNQKGNDCLPKKVDMLTKHGNSKDGCNICGSRINVIERVVPSLGKMNVCLACIK